LPPGRGRKFLPFSILIPQNLSAGRGIHVAVQLSSPGRDYSFCQKFSYLIITTKPKSSTDKGAFAILLPNSKDYLPKGRGYPPYRVFSYKFSWLKITTKPENIRGPKPVSLLLTAHCSPLTVVITGKVERASVSWPGKPRI
jgi:hypothetical protein